MTDAPLPPHERSWRHPSELGPTAASLEPSSRRSRILAVSSGAVAAVLVAVMVVAVTPKKSSAPSAVSATTTPPAVALIRTPAVVAIDTADAGLDDGMVRVGMHSATSGRPAAALVGAPNAISTAPTADPSSLSPATDRPRPDDRVLVLTAAFTYEVSWNSVADLWAPPGSIVITHSGELVATFDDDGRLVLAD